MGNPSSKYALLAARKHARRKAIQALYQWHLNTETHESAATDLVTGFIEHQEMGNADHDYFSEVVLGVVNGHEPIDALLVKQMERQTEQIDAIELSILQLATYELIERLEIPYKVIINEALELTKTYGADQGHKFVNGILDKLAAKLRTIEHSRRS